MKFSGLMCLGMKNICGNFRCKKKSTKKLSHCHFHQSTSCKV